MICGENDTDVILDADGQPVVNAYGDFLTEECWLQDLRLEAVTEQQETFFEDAQGTDSYGWGLLEFLQQEIDEFTEAEIQQRIREKLGKRSYIDMATVKTEIAVSGGREFKIHVSFQRQDGEKEYNIDLNTDGVEVILE